jgi:anti-sigma B factor antagonist
MAPISVTIEREHPIGILTLVGEHDAYSADRIASEIEVLLGTGIPVVVDLTEATFVDSQTLSTLLSARHQADVANLGFTLVLPEDTFTQVHRILRMTGLASWFATYPSLATARDGALAGHTSGGRLKVA